MSPLKQYGRYSTLGLELILWFGLGGYGGWQVDRHYGTHVWMGVGFAFGVFAGGYAAWKTVRTAQRHLEAEERSTPPRDP